jgi:hypothetical protein
MEISLLNFDEEEFQNIHLKDIMNVDSLSEIYSRLQGIQTQLLKTRLKIEE